MYKKLAIVVIIILTMILSSCTVGARGDKRGKFDPEGESKKEAALSTNLGNLLIQEVPELQIKQVNGNYYPATEQFTRRIIEKLRDNDHLAEDIKENSKFDVILNFTGYQEIFLDTATGCFKLATAPDVYKLANWNEDFWKRHVLKEVEGQIVYYTFAKDVLARNYLDFYQDGEEGEVLLYYDGDIRLKVKDKDITVLTKIPEAWIESMFSSQQLINKLYLEEDPQNHRYILLIGSLYSYVNRYGTTSWLSCYEYRDGILKETWNMKDLLASPIVVKDFRQGILSLEIKGRNVGFDIRLKKDEIRELNKYGEFLKEVHEKFIGKEDYLFFANLTRYEFYDYDSDGAEELIAQVYMRGGAAGITENIFFIYSFTEEGVKLKEILPAREEPDLLNFI